jgi:hypothetical protein
MLIQSTWGTPSVNSLANVRARLSRVTAKWIWKDRFQPFVKTSIVSPFIVYEQPMVGLRAFLLLIIVIRRAIQEQLDGKVVDWMEKVSNEQYQGWLSAEWKQNPSGGLLPKGTFTRTMTTSLQPHQRRGNC